MAQTDTPLVSVVVSARKTLRTYGVCWMRGQRRRCPPLGWKGSWSTTAGPALSGRSRTRCVMATDRFRTGAVRADTRAEHGP